MKQFKLYIIGFLATLAVYLPLDALWLGVIARDSYASSMAGLLREHYILWPWFVFYLTYISVITHLVVIPNHQNQNCVPVLMSGALLGVGAYGAYNLTGYSIIEGWPLGITLKDWGWGIFISAVSSFGGWSILRLIAISKDQ